MMTAAIPLALLVGAALVLAAGALFGRPAVITLAVMLAVLALIGVLSDLRRYVLDRDTATRRMHAMREADALHRILDGRLRRG